MIDVHVRLPDELHKAVKLEAARLERTLGWKPSLNQAVIAIVRRGLKLPVEKK